jgi:hypothetical protein
MTDAEQPVAAPVPARIAALDAAGLWKDGGA